MELTQACIENTAANTQALLATLDAQNLRYTVDEQTDARTCIRISFIGDDIPLTLHVILRTDRQIASVYSPMSFRCPPERTEDVLYAVTAANFGLLDGSFDFSTATGEIRFRLTSSYLESVLSETLFSYLMYVSAETVDRYNDRFAALCAGTMTREEFLAADAADKGLA